MIRVSTKYRGRNGFVIYSAQKCYRDKAPQGRKKGTKVKKGKA